MQAKEQGAVLHITMTSLVPVYPHGQRQTQRSTHHSRLGSFCLYRFKLLLCSFCPLQDLLLCSCQLIQVLSKRLQCLHQGCRTQHQRPSQHLHLCHSLAPHLICKTVEVLAVSCNVGKAAACPVAFSGRYSDPDRCCDAYQQANSINEKPECFPLQKGLLLARIGSSCRPALH